jgi:murein DD-endopeptidase MepM/ murein hydrolase activator NlpD
VVRPEAHRLGRARTYAAVAGIGLAFLPGAPEAHAGSGGAGVAPAPVVNGARCLASRGRPCLEQRWVKPGGTIEIRGRYLSSVKEVLFYGRPGKADNLTAPTRARRSGRVLAKVPDKARTGPVALVSSAGVVSKRWSGLVIDEQPRALPVPKQKGPLPAIGTTVSEPRKIFYGGLEKAVFTYQVTNSQPVDVTVNLIRLADHAVVRSWRQPQVVPSAPQKVVWGGTARGKIQAEGSYAFEVVAGAAAGSQATSTEETPGNAVALHSHVFPIQGRHDYGGAGGRFGAGRGGRSHRGQDVFAACGTPLIAARAGKVVYTGYHSLAGYYLVVRGKRSGLDYVYMHLKGPSLVKTDDQVYTGQQIGQVGESGNAHGCHLHFELWTAPGWYRGGHPIDPLPELKRWDAAS